MTHSTDIRRLEALADLMDSRFRIPGTGIRFGLDSILGLVPVAGDLATLLPALYLLDRARRHGAPLRLQLRMGFNATLDLLIGAIPVIGDLFDIAFKANRRNVRLLKRHLEREQAAKPTREHRFDDHGAP